MTLLIHDCPFDTSLPRGEFKVTGKSERLAKVFLTGLAFCTSVPCTSLSVVY